MAASRFFVTLPVDTQEGWYVKLGRVPVLIHTGGYPAPPLSLVCRAPLWPPAYRVLFNTQSTVSTSLSRHKAHRACGTTPCMILLIQSPGTQALLTCTVSLLHNGQIKKGITTQGADSGPSRPTHYLIWWADEHVILWSSCKHDFLFD